MTLHTLGEEKLSLIGLLSIFCKESNELLSLPTAIVKIVSKLISKMKSKRLRAGNKISKWIFRVGFAATFLKAKNRHKSLIWFFWVEIQNSSPLYLNIDKRASENADLRRIQEQETQTENQKYLLIKLDVTLSGCRPPTLPGHWTSKFLQNGTATI